MKIKLYQINLDRDEKRVAFWPYSSMCYFTHSRTPDDSIYDCVFDGEVEAQSKEDIFKIFNINRPPEYKGRSMSVSDILEISYPGNAVETEYYYCDAIGFERVRFFPSIKEREGR